MVPLISVKSHTARDGVRSYAKPSVCNFWSATRFYPWPSIVSLVRQRISEYIEIKSVTRKTVTRKTVTRKLKPITTNYARKTDCQLTSTKNERDLGVWISTDLRWNKQVNQQYSRANKELSYIRRNTRTIHNTTTRRTIYLALVRSHLSYATKVWTPQSVELLLKVERTQRRATKYILNLPFTCSIDYTFRLQALHLLPICYWHEDLDMVHFSKVTHGLTNSSFVLRKKTTRNTRTSNNTNTAKYGKFQNFGQPITELLRSKNL